MAETRPPAPFDEGAALEELERFRQEIARERARRKAVSDEFETFVGSFRKPDGGVATPAPVPDARPAVAAAPEAPAVGAPSITARPGAAPLEPPKRIEAPADDQVTLPRTRRRWRAMLLLAVLMIVAVAVVVRWPARDEPAPASATPAPASATPAPEAASPPPAPATPPPTSAPTEPITAPGGVTAPALPGTQPQPGSAAADATETALTTTRPVWVRVVADGARLIERELPAGARIPIAAQRTIVIRTGDADAVRLWIAGRDQGSLGRAGEVVTRTFTVPPR